MLHFLRKLVRGSIEIGKLETVTLHAQRGPRGFFSRDEESEVVLCKLHPPRLELVPILLGSHILDCLVNNASTETPDTCRVVPVPIRLVRSSPEPRDLFKTSGQAALKSDTRWRGWGFHLNDELHTPAKAARDFELATAWLWRQGYALTTAESQAPPMRL
jgi:hypothetical protein